MATPYVRDVEVLMIITIASEAGEDLSIKDATDRAYRHLKEVGKEKRWAFNGAERQSYGVVLVFFSER